MGLAIPLEGNNRIDAILEALERRGWARPPKARPDYREKLQGEWVWFGRLRSGEAYVLSSDVLGDPSEEGFLGKYRRGVRELEAEVEGLRLELGLPGVKKVELEFS